MLLAQILVKDIISLGRNMRPHLIIDEVAERVRDLNGKSLGTYSEYLEHGRLKKSQEIIKKI